MNWGTIDRYAKSLIKEAGHKIRVSFYKHIDIDTKADANDLVTNIDREVEQFFISRIKQDFPDHRILGKKVSAIMLRRWMALFGCWIQLMGR